MPRYKQTTPNDKRKTWVSSADSVRHVFCGLSLQYDSIDIDISIAITIAITIAVAIALTIRRIYIDTKK